MRLGQLEYNKPYKGDLVGSKIKILKETPVYNAASDSPNALDGYLLSGTYMIVAYIDGDPADTATPIWLLVADASKNVFTIKKDDSQTYYKVVTNILIWLLPLAAIGLYFVFGQKKRRA